MTTYIIEGARTIRVEADDISTRADGSLWLLRATRPRPAAMEPVLILARGQWSAVHVEQQADAILFFETPQPEKRGPRLLP
jgi:hypothetical protein